MECSLREGVWLMKGMWKVLAERLGVDYGISIYRAVLPREVTVIRPQGGCPLTHSQ
jgi:hypothetical protein